MTVRRIANICLECDTCGEHSEVEHSVKAARTQAKVEGWISQQPAGSKRADYCPQCCAMPNDSQGDQESA